ncbi:MAG TPA: hypothetical protein DC058_06325 [Planctomycetaceae bacterium]|nr:hypothetical protein [Planctomycetaceae bacterium]
MLTEFAEDLIENDSPALRGVGGQFDHAGNFESAELSDEGLPAFESLGAAGQEILGVGSLQECFCEVGG